jgi:glycosyltransferase involved in cell wall biosynthesis
VIRQKREEDNRAEFRYSHPDVDPLIADLVIAGLGGTLYYFWPMVRIPIEAAKVVGVRSALVLRALSESYPGRTFQLIRPGKPDMMPRARHSPSDVRARHGIPADAVVFGSFGRVTPEKCLTRVLIALSQVVDALPALRLLIVGDTPAYYDVVAQARDLGIGDRVAVTGYVDYLCWA